MADKFLLIAPGKMPEVVDREDVAGPKDERLWCRLGLMKPGDYMPRWDDGEYLIALGEEH